MDYYLGELKLWAADWEIEGWMRCEGQLLKTNEYQALFSIIGNRYGGDGIRTFALPDLRGRVPVSYGKGERLSYRMLGESDGQENTTLTVEQLPAHTHNIVSGDNKRHKPLAKLNALQGATTQTTDPKDNMLGVDDVATASVYAKSGTGTKVTLSPEAITIDAPSVYSNEFTGRGESHNNMQPFLVLSYIIAVSGGDYPPRRDY